MENKIKIQLSALQPYLEKNTVSAEEKKISGKDFVIYGDNNGYPQFLLKCYSECATLQSIINGCSDYITGNNIICNVEKFSETINKKGDTINDLISKIACDYVIFGAFAIQVIRNLMGDIVELYWIDVTKLRSDEKNEIFYYSDDWNKSYGRVKYLTFPKFSKDEKVSTSIYYFKNPMSRGTYGVPMYSASIKNVQIDIAITNFHNNEINNNFTSSKMISFCNGMPDDNLKNEIEKNLNEKFSGYQNAGRFLISYSDSRDNAPEVLDLGTDDFDTRYQDLEKRNTQQLFVAFRAQPILFGLQKENNGFSQDEFLQAYALFNRTVIKPIQNIIINSFDKILDVKNSITITPFSIEVADNTLTDKEVVS